MLILLRKSQMGLFATIPVHVKGSVRRDGTRVADHMSVRRKKLEPHQAQHQGGLFGDAPAAVAAVGAKLGAKLSQFLARHGGAARMADTLASFTPEQRAKMLDMMATLGGVSANEVHQALRASTDNRLAAKPAETGEPDLFSQPEASAPAPAKTSPRAMTDLNEDDVKQIKEAARYLKDVAYSTANLVDGDKNVMVRLSSELGKSGRGTLIMDAFNVTRDVAHSINNSLDVSQPRTLRAVDMEDAFTMFPKLRGIVDAARSKPAATAASTETHTTNVPEPAKAAEETSQAPAPQAEGASVPPGVRHELEGIVERLKGVRQRVDDAASLDTRFGSRGRYEADALDNVKGELTGPMGRLARLREVAAKKGVDLEATLTELGLPSFEPSAGAREWLDGSKKPAPAPEPAPAPVADTPAIDEPPSHAMTEPKVMHRAVSPEEWEHIKRTGEITGGANSFNAFDQRKHVFFGAEASEGVVRQGEDVTRRAEYQLQNGEIGARFAKLLEQKKTLSDQAEAHKAELLAGGKSLTGVKWDPKFKRLSAKLTELQSAIGALQSEFRAAASDKIKQLRAEDAARGYTSVVLETRPIDGGKRYTGKHSGMGDEDEFGFEPGHVKLADVTRVRYMKDGKQVREEPGPAAAAPAEQGPREGERNAEGLVFRDGRWHREDEPVQADYESMIRIASDSIGKLRASDVDRVLEQNDAKHRAGLAEFIKTKRPDLSGDVDEVMADLGVPAAPIKPAADEPFMRPEDKARSHLDALAVDVAGTIAEETRTHDFAPSELPKAIEYAAEGTGVAHDVLRKRVLEVLQADRFDISPARLKQVERALTKPVKPAATRTSDPNTTDRNAIVDTGDKLADYWSNSAGASIERDVKAGRVRNVDLTGLHPATTAPAPVAPFGVPAGTSKATRRDINTRVAAMVAAGETNVDLMRQYSGNGGCGDSLNEFYTDPAVAAAQWSVIQRLGITSGTALEPSCATGVFIHTAPAGFKVTGVEMDPISNACARALHGDRHEIAPPSSMERFATQDTRQFKVVVGNPPYGPRGALARDDKRDLKTAESYFVDTSLDKCEAGGIVSLVVPSGIMSSKNGRAFRERMLRKGEFLGAQRLPNSAFEASHTDVTTDVIWLRKRSDDVAGALMTVDKATLKALGVWDDEFLAGTYFDGRGKSNVFGTVGTAMRAFGEIYTVNGSMDGVPARVAEFEPHPVGKTPDMTDILAKLAGDDAATRRALGAASMPAYSKSKVGDTKTEDGVTYILDGDPPRWHRIDEFVATRPAVVDAAPLAAQIERSIAGLPVDHAQLKADVEAWVARYGIPGKHSDLALAAKADKRLFRLIGAVADGGELSDAVVGRDARKIEGSLETVATSLGLTRDTGTFSAADLAAASGKPADAVEDELFASSAYAYSGGGQWSTMSQYLTGSLWPKLDQVRRDMAHPDLPAGVASKYAEQARRLEAAIDQKSLEDVDFQINSGFLPLDVVSAFLNWRNHDAPTANDWTKKHAPVNVTMADSVYSVEGGSSYGTESLLAKYLNRTGVRKDDMPQIDALNDEFRQWLLTSAHRDRVEDLYNRAFRGFVAQEYSDEAFEIPGLASADLNRYHYSSLRRAIASGRGIIADDVGLGKTVRGLMLARMLKMTGKAKRPTFVVPKSVLANWVAESQKWFPGSRVLVIGETYTRDKDGNLKSKPDTATERSRKYHDLTQNDYDFVFISRPTFNELDVNPILKNKYLSEDFWVQRGDKLGNAGDKRVKKVREQYEQAVADREFTKRADSIWFDQLGIDALIMDEAHAYKNLYAAKARFGESPKFLGGQGLSNQAFDFNMKARHVRDANGGKGIFSLTATPTKNSPLEIYSMLAPVAPEEFERIGIRNSEEFLDRFCEFRSEKVLGTDGSIDDALVTAGFKNLDELREIMDRHIERRTAADVGLKLPGRDDRLHLVDMDAQQQAKYGELRALLAESGKKDSTGDAHVFSIMDKMGKAALDLELLDKDAYAGHASPKYREAAKHIKAGSAEGGQVVFCEAVDAHEKIASALVAAGIPREQIGILNGQAAASSAQRQNLSDAFNSGKLKVIIGNKTMEEGVNLQKATTDIHHLDLPWDPATLQQRNGRGLRQGNRNEAVRIHTYLSRGSFDGYRHQSMTAKRDWMDLLWSGGARVENLAREGNFSREDLMIMMSADPDAERAKMDADKAAAVERHAAGKRTEAAESFVRFQSLKRSYNGLKNKETAAALRLRQQMEKAKTGLANNKFFGAKAALDVNDEVVLHPQTHDMLTRDVGVEVDEADGTKSRWVVTGADAVKGEVGMRRYADTTGSRGVTVPLDKLAAGSRVFKFDKAAEGNEVREHMEKAAVAKLEGVEKLEDVQKMPGHVIEANYDLLQRRLKDAAANHKLGAMGNVAMIDKATGKVKSMAYYSAAKAHETHDYALPTDAHREAAIKQWMEERRDARIGSRYVDKPGRRSRGAGGNSDRVLGREHPGADMNKHINPMREVLNAMDGHKAVYGAVSDGPSVRAARARLETEQVAKIKGAKTASEAISALIPLGNVGKDSVTYPPRALAMAWVKAKRAGVLNDKLIDHQASSSGYLAHTSETYGGSAHDATVKQALMRMAAAAGKTAGLVPAMSRDVDADLTAGEPQKHREHVKTLLDVLGSTKGGDTARLAAAREAQRVVEKIGAGGVPKRNFLGGSSGYGFYGYSPDDNKPLSKYLAEQVEALENRKASAPAAATKETA